MSKISLVRRIGKGLGEYFLGIENTKFFNEEREFYEKQGLERMASNSENSKRYFLIMGKAVPNIIDSGAIIYSLVTKDIPYGLFVFVEGMRSLFALQLELSKKWRREIGNLAVEGVELSRGLGEAAEMLDKASKDLGRSADKILRRNIIYDGLSERETY